MALFSLRDRQNVTWTLEYDDSPPAPSYDWSDSNLPWAYTSVNDWEQYLPAGVPVVPLSAVAGDFWTKLNATVNAQPGRFILRLPEGVFTLTSFRAVGSSGDPTYAFGFYFAKLAGIVGAGADKTIIEMAPNSVSTAQLDKMKTMTQSSFIQLQMGMFRFDSEYGGVGAPMYLGGVTVEAAPQPLLTSIASDIEGNVYVPQSAPHLGVVVYSSSSRRHSGSYVAYARFRGAGKAMMSQPPFELSNFTSQRNDIRYVNSEFDGRMSPRYDASQPRKCVPFMTNGGITQIIKDCWMHHSNVSRYAANDEAVASPTALSNTYRMERMKIDQITNTRNEQAGINGGNSLGGYTNASNIGFESSNALIEIIDCIVSVDNPYTNGQVPCHIQFTSTGANRVGGKLYVKGGEFRHTVYPQLNGFCTARVQTTSPWYNNGTTGSTAGLTSNFDIRLADDTKLSPYIVTGTWPPTAATLAAAGVTPQSHFLVRNA